MSLLISSSKLHGFIRTAVFAVGFAVLALHPTSAEARRVALIIGNSTYAVKPLDNPRNDSAAIAAEFKDTLGFDSVILKNDLNRQQMVEALQDFGREAAGAEIAVFYFAGHGTALETIDTFLLPTDAKLARLADLEDEAISLRSVLRRMERVQGLRLVILDACRNPPFALAGGTRDVSRGLTRVEPEDNTLVAYATKDGTTADDGTGQHSPFTSALLKHIGTPGIDVTFVFRKVRDDVMSATSRLQQPHLYGTLGGKPIYLRKGTEQTGAEGDQVALHTPATEPPQAFVPTIRPEKRTAQVRIMRKSFEENSGSRGWLGIEFRTEDSRAIAKFLNLGDTVGAWVVKTVAGGPAEQIGIQPGDFVVSLDGRKLSKPDELPAIVNLIPLDTQVPIEYWRYGSGTTDLLQALRKAAEKQDGVAAVTLAQMHSTGIGVPPSKDEALRHYRIAADGGIATAMAILGDTYANGEGVAKDLAEAVRWYRKGAISGNARSMTQLGWYFESGQGVGKDEAEAVRWYRRGAEAGNAIAMVNLGWMYESGRGIGKDDAEATRWYRKGAESGNARSMGNYAWMLENGAGIAKNEAEGARWYTNGARGGDIRSMFNLGVNFQEGRGVVKDQAAAVAWFQKSAGLGYLPAMHMLAALHDDGRGVAKNPTLAGEYIMKCLRGGYEFSQKQMQTNWKRWSIGFRRDLQQRLATAGVFQARIDGNFGPTTFNAINAVYNKPQ